ncbi:MAG: lysine--tRNA ligase [Candidatus Pacearchaeota archaeon]
MAGRKEQIVGERLRKIGELKISGTNPYPQRFEKKNMISECFKIDKKVKTAGRLVSKRDIGKIIFSKIQDESGSIQVVLQEGKTKQEFIDFFKSYIDLGDIVGVSGKVIKTKTGEISILCEKLELLSKSVLPLPEKWHGLQEKEDRYRKRYLDMIVNPEVLEVFKKKSVIIDTIRGYLKKNNFTEVETPNLQAIYGGASAEPFRTHLNALDMDLFLSISPELYLKRLIVGGFDRVFTISKNFRNEGIDATHNPEFTMMEFYCAYSNYEKLMVMTEEMLKLIFKNLKIKEEIKSGEKLIKFKFPIKRVRFWDLILEKTGIDLEKMSDFDSLKEEIERKGIKGVDISGCKHYGALLDELYKRVVRPSIVEPIFLTHYPVEMIALAKRNEENPRLINTFQLIVDGAELVKAYDELNDPFDQEKRLKEQADLLCEGDREAMPMDIDFIEALKTGMPPTAGYGMGIDRIAILLTEQESIRDVIPFPFMKPEVED